jgi:hypothetical protein
LQTLEKNRQTLVCSASLQQNAATLKQVGDKITYPYIITRVLEATL